MRSNQSNCRVFWPVKPPSLRRLKIGSTGYLQLSLRLIPDGFAWFEGIGRSLAQFSGIANFLATPTNLFIDYNQHNTSRPNEHSAALTISLGHDEVSPSI
jgi:hypothetical protein